MSNRKLVKVVKILHRRISRLFVSLRKIGSNIWGVLRTLLLMGRRRPGTSTAGFVLPTVVMVTMVVILLTTAILFRSFERSQNASNVRVNEMTLKAATPALDRARAKLDKLFADGRLPRATPNDTALYETFVNNINEYTFGDEKQLRLVDRNTTSQNPNPQNPPTEIRTAWQFPVDTDNNGKFDSYTLYTINFRTPPVVNGLPSRARTAIEARTPPMIGGQQGGGCEDVLGTSATLVGDTGWSKVGTQLKKSFFVYTANVPIAELDANLDPDRYEKYRGNQGFSAIEYQQDRAQLPLINNAVVYEDDLEITPGPNFRLNGRIITNSNLLTGGNPGTVTLYQVSSPYSCFYEPEN
ncbi:MAG: hormogonium polysaccharide biosynthesis protein HpsA, partial [Nostocaceae cyanobacterium]|nr:hormogonium polysaccharide biosynthesis protein HpsA [Nostocaceae cyanobacterium]